MKKVLLIFFLLISITFLLCINRNKEVPNFINKDLQEVETYCNKNKINLKIEKKYSDDVLENKIIEQDISDNNIKVIVSLGKNMEELYQKYNVNELGKIPIMMYHGIQDIDNNKYIGGNIDKDGYQRTAKAFKEDLEFYYKNGYRMIKLSDYVNGVIDVELGYSPIVITFDDGLSNNIKVIGRDSNGKIIIDPNSAVGIMEEFKNKYPDYNVTATFFISNNLFNQSAYNEEILLWMIEHNYSIGNHTISHASLDSITEEQLQKEIGNMYQKLESIIGNNYIPVVALPFGKPYSKEHSNFKYILNGVYNNKDYQTLATLRVGWESELSPFNKYFDKTYLKRIRAYDNNGLDFDIKYNFNILEKTRYISDGNKDTVVIRKDDKDKVNTNLKLILY